jgi:putative ABC transport system ATP-binding protein|tara:strand:- start:188 stop:898 length:711 start_codon:yes stop_codon:yes gene_type:complete
MNIVEATGLKKYYRRGVETVRALDGVNLCLMPGELVAMVGPSGSGKTTLMNLISCLDTPTAGQLKVADCDVTQAVEHELVSVRRDFIGFIFQQFHLIPTLTATENAELPTLFSRKKFQRKDTIRLLERVGLEGCEHLFPYHLSAGDKQRVAIARALVNDPKLLIADEPTGKLETAVRDSLLSLFRNLANGGLSIFIATHDLELAVACDRILYLQDGVLVSAEESSLFMETVSARYC